MSDADADELSCEPCKACGHPKALHRSNDGACFAEPHRNRPCDSSVEDVEQRKKLGVECWCRNYQSSIPTGIDAVLKYGDAIGLVAAANAALERGDYHDTERLLDCHIRKVPQSERDSDWINATERSIARLKFPHAGANAAPEQPFQWEDLDRRIVRHKTSEIADEMHKRAKDGERQIASEESRNANSGAYLHRYFDLHERLADEWAGKLYEAYCATCREQNRKTSPAFIRTVRDNVILVVLSARENTVIFEAGLRGMRINEPPNPHVVAEWSRRMDRLRARWCRKLEAHAAAAEYQNASPAMPATNQVPEPKMENRHTPEVWHALYELFDDLSAEELKAEPENRHDRWMRAHVSYEDPNCEWGDWHISKGINEKFKARFEVAATRAGIALSGTGVTQLLHIWLHHLFQHLLQINSSLLLAGTDEGGIVIRICEASAVFCSRLELAALAAENGIAADKISFPSTTLIQVPSKTTEREQKAGDSPRGLDDGGQERIRRQAVIKKVESPQTYTTLTVNEASLYFGVRPRTINRWLHDGHVRGGPRRGSITTESIRRWQKKRSRKPRSKNADFS